MPTSWSTISKPSTTWTGVDKPTTPVWNVIPSVHSEKWATVWMPPVMGRDIYYVLRNLVLGYDSGVPYMLTPWTLEAGPTGTWSGIDKPTNSWDTVAEP